MTEILYLARSSIAAVLFAIGRWLSAAGDWITVWVCDDCGKQRTDARFRDSVSIRCDDCQRRWETT